MLTLCFCALLCVVPWFYLIFSSLSQNVLLFLISFKKKSVLKFNVFPLSPIKFKFLYKLKQTTRSLFAWKVPFQKFLLSSFILFLFVKKCSMMWLVICNVCLLFTSQNEKGFLFYSFLDPHFWDRKFENIMVALCLVVW